MAGNPPWISQFSFADIINGEDLSPENDYSRIDATYPQSTRRYYGEPSDSYYYQSDTDRRLAEMMLPLQLDQGSPPPPNVAELPVEIWIKIISLAIHIPGAYTIDDYSAIAGFTLDYLGVSANDRVRQTTRDKVAFARVSKLWNAILQKFLFQHIRIGNGVQVYALAEIIKQSTRRNGPRPGNWTIRIDIALEGEHSWVSQHSQAVAFILQHCPNLVCFSTAFSNPDPWVYYLPNLIKSLAGHRSLRRLEVKVEKDVLRTIEQYLGRSIEVLWLLPCRRLVSLDRTKDTYTLPRLRTLVASPRCEAHVQKLVLPNLRAGTFEGEEKSTLPAMDKSRIKHLSLANMGIVMNDRRPWANLRTLSIKYYNVATQKINWAEALPHHALECITINELVQHPPQIAQGYLAENMYHIISRSLFPNLKRARIGLPSRDGQGFRQISFEKNVWGKWLESCHRYGIKLEISQGSEERMADEWTKISAQRLNRLMFPNRR